MTVATETTTGAVPSPSEEDVIVVNKMNKWYGNFHVLRDIDLTVRKGERIVICGPSGSGKSTLIRTMNRLETYQSGEILVDGILLGDDVINIEA
ncbi:ATP-binding cassette domain-containing protein, partial [Thalassospira sp.]|uniref:ATP-binding cassette domain-containing protein n=1 Tax=Thalassospira sp. TaxID=1912094 RepID=UPI00311F072C